MGEFIDVGGLLVQKKLVGLEWIDTRDRLPIVGGLYLTFDPHQVWKYQVQVFCMEDKTFRANAEGWRCSSFPTFWMPLPESPPETV